MRHRNPVPEETGNNTAFWVVAGLMALIVVGGLAYGLSYPALQASNPSPPQTTGQGGDHGRTGHPQ